MNKKGENFPELLERLNQRLKSNVKLDPYINLPKDLLKEVIREGKRFIKQVEKK